MYSSYIRAFVTRLVFRAVAIISGGPKLRPYLKAHRIHGIIGRILEYGTIVDVQK